MARNPYGTYRGRKSWGKRILIGIVVLLVIALILAVVGVVFLRDNIVYTDHGIEFTLPFGRKDPDPTQSAEPSPLPTESELVVETASPSPSPSPSATPKPEMSPRRDTPLGLVVYGEDTVLAGDQGAIFVAPDVDSLTAEERETVRARNLALPYAAAYVAPDWAAYAGLESAEQSEFFDALARQYAGLAGLGFDEIVLGWPDISAVGEMTFAGDVCTRLRADMDALGFRGRLSLECRRELFTDAALMERLLPSVAVKFDRIYAAAGDSWGGLNIYRTLKDLEFSGTQRDIVTVTHGALSGANYAWAVLP